MNIKIILVKTCCLIISSIAGQIIATPDIGCLFVLYSFEFRTFCDPVSKPATITATAFICNNKTKQILEVYKNMNSGSNDERKTNIN